MQVRWERAPAPPIMHGALYMDAELRPHRSLSGAGFKLLFGVLVLMNLGVALYMIAQGALLVLPFLGLDVLAVWLAFRWNYRAARRAEYVRIGREHVHIAATDARGETSHWVINPLWVRVAAEEGPGVVIRAQADQMRVGAFMGAEQSASFAAAVSAALSRAKRGG